MYDQFTLPVSTSSPTISVFTEIRISSEKPTFTFKFFKGACSHQDEIIAMQKNTTKRKLIRSIIYFFYKFISSSYDAFVQWSWSIYILLVLTFVKIRLFLDRCVYMYSYELSPGETALIIAPIISRSLFLGLYLRKSRSDGVKNRRRFQNLIW